MTILGISILLIVIAVVLAAPRPWALLGVMAGVLYITQGQQVQILGFNLYAHRFIELAAFTRVLIRKEFLFSRIGSIDKILLLLFGYTTIVFFLRSSDSPTYHFGAAVDAYLCFFAFRGLLGGTESFRWFLKAFLILLVPYVALLLVESVGKQNLFTSMGGIEYGDWQRGGRPRCQGSFRHPSLLGTLGASFLPLYIGLWFVKPQRGFAMLGIGLCLIIVWTSNSGGPASMTAIGLTGWLFWRFRSQMRLVRRFAFFGIVILAILMKAPIWYLPAKVSSLSGGDGYHRSYLMEMAYKSFGNWWFAGMSIAETTDWFPYQLEASGGADMTNQFLAFGVTAGVGAMGLFMILLVHAFNKLGAALAAARSQIRIDQSEPFLWAVGVTLLAHIFNWLGITYFDQTYMIWYLLLAAISNLTSESLHSNLPKAQ